MTEPWASGDRLVIVDEVGDRRAPLLAEPGGEEHPAFSPDGRWLVFASRRGRDDGKTSVWAAPAMAEATPVRLTDGPDADVDPVWEPDGAAIVFVRAHGGGTVLERLPIAAAGHDGAALAPSGPPAPLTDGAALILAPTAAGGRLVFQVIERDPPRSYLAERDAAGAIVPLSDGPSDGSPALSPDGNRVAYATAVVRPDGGRDLDVIVIDVGGARAGEPSRGKAGTPLAVAIEGTDEGSPAWSVDGRWLFVTSVVRDADGAPVLSSVVHVDTWARPPRVRMLRDDAGAIPRLGPALAPTILDAAALGRNPDYLPALARAIVALERAAAERREREHGR